VSQVLRNGNGAGTPAQPGRVHRREQRFEIPIEIEVSGIGRDGKAFHECAVTSNVSEWGCAFPLSVELKADDIIAVRVLSTNASDPAPTGQTMFQVVRVQRDKDGWAVGAWKMDGGDTWATTIQKIAKSKGREAESIAALPSPPRKVPGP
jgi:hypothetical protein